MTYKSRGETYVSQFSGNAPSLTSLSCCSGTHVYRNVHLNYEVPHAQAVPGPLCPVGLGHCSTYTGDF